MVENIENHISKGSRSMFARQFDVCFYTVVKQDLKMTDLGQICPKVSDIRQGLH